MSEFKAQIGNVIASENRKIHSENVGKAVIEMVYIPDGTFLMGSTDSAEQSDSREKPQRQVTVAPFWMGKTQVTQAQWKAVAALPQIISELNPEPSYFKGEDRPVENVSWYDSIEFCARLANFTGRPYRLPSEAEWEYACKAGTTTQFHFGDTITSELANLNGNYAYNSQPKGKHRQETINVGSLQVPNDFGLYDMHGNVWEWCADPWHENYVNAPSDGRVWEDGGDDNYRMLRGGCWLNRPRFCRSAVRYRLLPDTRESASGLRIVVSSI
jgi:formylglycine-generating enzyme required for sulfatase activity